MSKMLEDRIKELEAQLCKTDEQVYAEIREIQVHAKIEAARELAGIFHDGEWRSNRAMTICETYASLLALDELTRLGQDMGEYDE